MKILVVDDQNFNLVITQEYLKNMNVDCETIICKNPAQCFDIVENENLDIILLDLVMEPISGMDVLARLRANPKYDNIIIVMFTGFSDRESLRQCYELGADDYISKPVEESEFKARMNGIINHRKNILKMEELSAEVDELRRKIQDLEKSAEKAQPVRVKFSFAHNNINVLNLEKSVAFYREALGLKISKTYEPEDKSFMLVYLTDGHTGHLLELTWLRDRVMPYDLGDNEIHLAFAADHFDAAYEKHTQMGCICYENTSMGIYFISDPDGYWSEIIR
jgi:lactoylglutathione lyase